MDRAIQRAKRRYNREFSDTLLINMKSNQQLFWKDIANVGIGKDKKKPLPTEVLMEDFMMC